MLQIRETFVNETEGYRFGDTEWYEPYTDDRSELFRSLQKEYGGCISRMYRDEVDGGASEIGWVFSKWMPYEDDPKRRYVREVWVQTREVIR